MHFSHLTAAIIIAFSVGTLAMPTTNNAILESRESNAGTNSNLTINAFALANCEQGSNQFATHQNVVYGANNPAQIVSYNLSRALGPSEQLDFSTSASGTTTAGTSSSSGIPEQCALFQESVSPQSNGQPLSAGCYTLDHQASCFNFWQH